MFYILSKLLTFVLQPIYWLLIIGYWAFSKRIQQKKRLAKTLFFSLLLVFTNPYIHHRAMLAWQLNQQLTLDSNYKRYDVGIVLGGMAKFDQQGNGYWGFTSDRCMQAVLLYKQGVIKKILVTGGSNSFLLKEPAEADFVCSQLAALGIPKQDILKENRSRNTFQNAIFSKALLDSCQLRPPYVLISSASHLRRSKAVFEKAGMQVITHAAAFDAVDKKIYWTEYVLPDFQLIFAWPSLIKEAIGICVYSITGKA